MFVEDVNRPNSHVLQDAPLVLAVFCTFAIITKNAINYILNPACSVLNRYFPTAIQKEQMALDFGEFSLSQKNNLTTKVLAIDKKNKFVAGRILSADNLPKKYGYSNNKVKSILDPVSDYCVI